MHTYICIPLLCNEFIILFQLEKMRISRELEEKLEAESQRYEERITELHCVIAELRRKLEQQRGHAIAEDDEEELAEDDEISQDLNYQSGI